MNVNEITSSHLTSLKKIAARACRQYRYKDEVESVTILEFVTAINSGLSEDDAFMFAKKEAYRQARREWTEESRVSFTAHGSIQPESPNGALWDALKALPPRQYRAVVLHFWGGLEHEEVAAEIGCTVKSSERLVERALSTIKEILVADRGFLLSSMGTYSRGKNSKKSQFFPIHLQNVRFR